MEKVKKQLLEFCSQTTIHGFAYLTDTTSWIITRLFWSCVIVGFLSTALILVQEAFKDWSENPTVTTIESTSASVEELPFPSVTVCQEGMSLTQAERWSLPAEILNAHYYSCPTEQYVYNCSLSYLSDDLVFKKVGRGIVLKMIGMEFWRGVFLDLLHFSEERVSKHLMYYLKKRLRYLDHETVVEFCGMYVARKQKGSGTVDDSEVMLKGMESFPDLRDSLRIMTTWIQAMDPGNLTR